MFVCQTAQTLNSSASLSLDKQPRGVKLAAWCPVGIRVTADSVAGGSREGVGGRTSSGVSWSPVGPKDGVNDRGRV